MRRFLGLGTNLGAEAERVIDDGVPVDDAASDRQDLERVARDISALPAILRETLIMRTIEGLSQTETAAILSISEKAVETRLSRARSKLLSK